MQFGQLPVDVLRTQQTLIEFVQCDVDASKRINKEGGIDSYNKRIYIEYFFRSRTVF